MHWKEFSVSIMDQFSKIIQVIDDKIPSDKSNYKYVPR